jgi:hypothetical protein
MSRKQANGSPPIKPSDRWRDAINRAKVESTIIAGPEDRSDPKKKWWNAKNVITGLQHQEESDESDLEEALEELEVDDPKGGHNNGKSERRHRLKNIKKMKKGRIDAKTMESPVTRPCNIRLIVSISSR